MQSYGLMVLVLVNREAVLQGNRVAGVSQHSQDPSWCPMYESLEQKKS